MFNKNQITGVLYLHKEVKQINSNRNKPVFDKAKCYWIKFQNFKSVI